MGWSMNGVERIKIREGCDMARCWVSGLFDLPGGGWLVAEDKKKLLKRLDDCHWTMDRYDLPSRILRDICLIPDHNRAAVATRFSNTVEVVSLEGKMRRLRPIKINHNRVGVTYIGGMLYVTGGGKEVHECHVTYGELSRVIRPQDTASADILRHAIYHCNGRRSLLFITDTKRGLFVMDTKTGNILQHVDVGDQCASVCAVRDNGVCMYVAVLPGKIVHVAESGQILGTVVSPKMMESLGAWKLSYQWGRANSLLQFGRNVIICLFFK